jgi:hypothetical protein
MDIPIQAIEYMKEAINSSDVVLVRELCREFGIPKSIRLDVWKMFLPSKREIVEITFDSNKNNLFKPTFIQENELNVIDESNNTINVTRLYEEIKKQAQKSAVDVNIPMVGTLTLNESDVEKLYSYIKNANEL